MNKTIEMNSNATQLRKLSDDELKRIKTHDTQSQSTPTLKNVYENESKHRKNKS